MGRCHRIFSNYLNERSLYINNYLIDSWLNELPIRKNKYLECALKTECMKRKSVRKKNVRGEDEKRIRASKRHRLSADEKNIGTYHLAIKLNT